jgi:hypothetical protein
VLQGWFAIRLAIDEREGEQTVAKGDSDPAISFLRFFEQRQQGNLAPDATLLQRITGRPCQT